MSRYTQDDRDKALGALMASATLVGVEWVPNFRAVARVLKVSARTLERWWESRDQKADAALRRAVTREREALVEEGAGDFLEAMVEGYQRIARYIINPIHYRTTLVRLPGTGRLVRVKGVRPDQAAKALQITAGLHKDLKSLLSGEQGEERKDPLAHARAAAERTRLVEAFEAEEEAKK